MEGEGTTDFQDSSSQHTNLGLLYFGVVVEVDKLVAVVCRLPEEELL